MNKKIKIGIDGRFYGPIGKGLGRYAQELIDNLLKIDQFNDYVIFLAKDNFDYFKTENPRVKKVLVDARWYTLKEQFLFPWLIYREKLSLMHFLHFNVPVFCPVKFLVTIHDLILINFPTARATTLGPIKYFLKNIGYRFVIWSAVKRAKTVVAVSEFTKQDVIKHFKITPEKVVVTYEGVADHAVKMVDSKFSTEILSSYGINGPYLLYIGNAYPHKNLEGLIDVFAELVKVRDVKLVLVGKEDYFYSRVKEYAKNLGLYSENKNGQVIFTGYVPDDKLSVLYKNGLVYVFASFFEGFGLPPLEAMANGLPVISSNRTSMPEVLGEAAEYFNPEDKNEMVEKIKNLIDDKNRRLELSEKGFEQVKFYSWDSCARETLELYK